MPKQASKIRALVSELQRRKVFNTLVLYIVGCWVLVQVFAMAFEIFEIDNSYYYWVLALFALLLPVVLIISWFYQLTTRGFVRLAPFVERRVLNNMLPRGDRRSVPRFKSSDKEADDGVFWSIFAESGPVEGLEYAITKPVTLGRAVECDITLMRSFISRTHARMKVEGVVLSIEDLGSSNGTLVNGVRVEGTQVLYDGDELRFKDVVFRVREHSSKIQNEAMLNQTTVIEAK